MYSLNYFIYLWLCIICTYRSMNCISLTTVKRCMLWTILPFSCCASFGETALLMVWMNPKGAVKSVPSLPDWLVLSPVPLMWNPGALCVFSPGGNRKELSDGCRLRTEGDYITMFLSSFLSMPCQDTTSCVHYWPRAHSQLSEWFCWNDTHAIPRPWKAPVISLKTSMAYLNLTLRYVSLLYTLFYPDCKMQWSIGTEIRIGFKWGRLVGIL